MSVQIKQINYLKIYVALHPIYFLYKFPEMRLVKFSSKEDFSDGFLICVHINNNLIFFLFINDGVGKDLPDNLFVHNYQPTFFPCNIYIASFTTGTSRYVYC